MKKVFKRAARSAKQSENQRKTRVSRCHKIRPYSSTQVNLNLAYSKKQMSTVNLNNLYA